MLTVGLIQELLASNLSGVHDQEIVYFLIQDTEKELNEGAAVLRALMWLLLVQNPGLARHLRPSYEESGSALFNDPMAFTSLLAISNKMGNDNGLGQVDLLIDALDKYGTPSKVKILVTSRSLLEIDEKMKNISASSKAVIRLDDHSLSGPINIYIDRKRTLFEGSMGDENLVNQTVDRLKGNTGRTFL